MPFEILLIYPFRYDWYQTQTHVIVTILLKNVKQEDMTIDIQERSVSIFGLFHQNLQAKYLSEKRIEKKDQLCLKFVL